MLLQIALLNAQLGSAIRHFSRDIRTVVYLLIESSSEKVSVYSHLLFMISLSRPADVE